MNLNNYIKGKRLIWKKYFRCYCGGGYPIYRICKMQYYKLHHWKLQGFRVIFFGAEVFIEFGKDINGFYRR